MKNRNISILILALLFLLIPILFYSYIFWNYPFSNETETWGHFGDYLNGTFMPIIALAGVFVTFELGLISENRNVINLKIEQQKLRPLLHLGYYDDECFLRIFIKNKGEGPLLITDYRLINLETNESKTSIFDILPSTQNNYDNYTGNQNNTVLSAEDETELFFFELNENKDENFENDKNIIRETISKYKIVVDYKDVYDNKMPTYERSLEWFG